MKKLKFHYEMELAFDNLVREHHFRFRCLPFSDNSQRCYGLRYGVEPAGSLHETRDGFGNRVCAGEALAPHQELKVWAEGTVFRDDGAKRMEECQPLFRFPSEFTGIDPGLEQFFREVRGEFSKKAGGRIQETEQGKDSGKEFVCFLMHRLSGRFSYAPGRTDVRTTAAQAFAGGGGVCQDYAHILTALLRQAGYSARYVAGMMLGEGATHAWVEVWTEGHWLGFDPTHDRLAGEDYIKLSHGRDFGDCTVDRGCFQGCTSQKQNIYVKVDEII